MRLRDLPIRRKLTLGALLVSGTALALALAACFALQIQLARSSAQRDVEALAEVVAANAAGPLAFRDGEAATRLLAGLRVRPEIVGAQLRDASGAVLGRVGGAVGAGPAAGSRLDGFRLEVTQPVSHQGETLGRLELIANVRGTVLRLAAIAGVVFLAVFGAALAIAWLLARRWQHTITGPLLALAGTAGDVAARNDYALRAPRHGDDEIGRLTDAFNRMLTEVQARDLALREAHAKMSNQVAALQHEIAERQRAEAELARTHRDLVDASRRAGQAEVATSVLHNVGNVLNSVIVSATLTSEKLRSPRLGNVARAGELLVQHRAELGPFFEAHPKGRMFLDYLPELGRQLESERAAAVEELQSVVKNIGHIKEIVAMQQSYARAGGAIEVLPLAEIVDDALALDGESLEHHGITVVRRYAELPPRPVDKHRLLQILVNLIRNAKEALKAGPALGERTLELGIEPGPDGGAVVRVADNGVGIPRENLTRIFQHGFTTRANGHGFGLHSAAIAARELGGRLVADSPGPGLGAVFTLELPAKPRAA